MLIKVTWYENEKVDTERIVDTIWDPEERDNYYHGTFKEYVLEDIEDEAPTMSLLSETETEFIFVKDEFKLTYELLEG